MTTNYDLTNTQLYPKALMEKRAWKLFITIPHTDLSPAEALEVFKTYRQITYCKVAQEHHEDGDTHIHIYMSFKNQTRYNSVHNLLKLALNGKRIHGTIDYRIPESSIAVCKYIDKEGVTAEFGERPQKVGKAEASVDRNTGALEAIQLAQQGNTAEAMQILIKNQPMRILENMETIQENLKKLNQTRIKYDVPVYTQENTIFKKWQQELLDFIKEPPKKRRIIWVVGEPESGKTFIHDYLSNLDNYAYGLYDAGQSVSYDNVVYGYDEEGIIAWDFPMNYDWATFETAAGNIIEKFSDFGTTISSKKYKGNTKVVRGHCLVFSNRPPLEGLSHREVVVIQATPEKEKIDKIDKTDKTHSVDSDILDETDKTQSMDAVEQIETDAVKEFKGVKVDIFNPGLTRHDTMVRKINALWQRLHYLREQQMNYDEQKQIQERLLYWGEDIDDKWI